MVGKLPHSGDRKIYLSKDCGSDVSLLNPIRQPNEWATKYHGVVNFFFFR